MSEHKFELVLRVDGADVETLALDGSRALMSAERREDGAVVVVFSVDNDGLPPESILRGGAGYHGAHTLVVQKVPVGKDRLWRLVRAVGWTP